MDEIDYVQCVSTGPDHSGNNLDVKIWVDTFPTPQMYIEGLQIAVDGKLQTIDPICIWFNDADQLIAVANQIRDRVNYQRFETEMIKTLQIRKEVM